METERDLVKGDSVVSKRGDIGVVEYIDRNANGAQSYIHVRWVGKKRRTAVQRAFVRLD